MHRLELNGLYSQKKALIQAAEYITWAIAPFIPTNMEHSEVYREAIYTVSRVLSSLNVASNDVTGDPTLVVEPWLRKFTGGLSHIEVLLEKISESFIGVGLPSKNNVIVSIELAKTLFRLIMLVEKRRACMLLNWGKDEKAGVHTDMCHYTTWHAQIFAQQARAPQGISLFADRRDTHDAFQNSNNDDIPALSSSPLHSSYIGKRSGLTLNLDVSAFHSPIRRETGTPPRQQEQERQKPRSLESAFDAHNRQVLAQDQPMHQAPISDELACMGLLAKGIAPHDTKRRDDSEDIASGTTPSAEGATTKKAVPGGGKQDTPEVGCSDGSDERPHMLVGAGADAGVGADVDVDAQPQPRCPLPGTPPLTPPPPPLRPDLLDSQWPPSVPCSSAASASAPATTRPSSSPPPQTSGDEGADPRLVFGTWTPAQALIFGEVLYILRPTVYALALQQFTESPRPPPSKRVHHSPGLHSPGHQARGSAEWWRLSGQCVALIVSLAVEMASIGLTQAALTAAQRNAFRDTDASSVPMPLSGRLATRESRQRREQDISSAVSRATKDQRAHPHPYDVELSRRKAALFFYLLRSPLFDATTQPALLGLSSLTSFIPILGSIPNYVLGILEYLHSSHFYSSASS